MSHGMDGPSMSHGMPSFSMPYGIPSPSIYQTPAPEIQGRPQRQVLPGIHLRPPYTDPGTTTAEPDRARARGRGRGRGKGKGQAEVETSTDELEVLKIFRTTGFPDTCKITLLPNKVLNRQWWLALIGEDGSGKFFSSVSFIFLSFSFSYNT